MNNGIEVQASLIEAHHKIFHATAIANDDDLHERLRPLLVELKKIAYHVREENRRAGMAEMAEEMDAGAGGLK